MAIQEELGRAVATDQYATSAGSVGSSAREVHSVQYAEDAGVWRFILLVEAYTSQEGVTREDVMEQVDQVFSGMQGIGLPVVEYHFVDDEHIKELIP